MSLEDQKDSSSIPRNKSSIHLKVKNDIEGVKNPAYDDEVKPKEIDHLNHVEIVDNLHKRVSQLEKDVETVDNLHKRVLQLERDKVKVSFCLTRNSNDSAASAQNQSRTNPAIADDLKEHEEHTVKTEEVSKYWKDGNKMLVLNIFRWHLRRCHGDQHCGYLHQAYCYLLLIPTQMWFSLQGSSWEIIIKI